MAAFPGTLPTKPQMRGWKEIPGDTSITTQMEVGPPKKRNRSTLPLDEFEVTYILTTAQRATLLTFFHTTTSSGANDFEWTHPMTSATLNVIFVTPPVFVAHGVDYLCSFKLKEVD